MRGRRKYEKMNIINVENITKSYTGRKLFSKASFYVQENEKIGIIGINGTGKSTLLKIVAGDEEPDEGTVTTANHIVINYLPQNPEFDPDETALEHVMSRVVTSQLDEDMRWSIESDAKSLLMKLDITDMAQKTGELSGGQTIKIGYFGQEVDIEPELRVIDYVKEAAEFVRTADGLVSASAMLERFLFPPEQQYSPVGKLSGGEKRRLYLLRVLMSAPNVLILDEPTNDLDVETLAILEDYLDGYDGIVITVSHDRYFLDRIAKRIFAFEGAGKIVQYEGGYTDYMNKRPQPASGKTVSENASSTGASASGAQGNTASDGTDSKEARKKKSMETWGHEKKLKFTYKEQKEYETIEADIEKLENRLSEIDDEMVKNATNFGKLNELTKEKEDLEGQLMEKMERWEYLEDLAQKIANLT